MPAPNAGSADSHGPAPSDCPAVSDQPFFVTAGMAAKTAFEQFEPMAKPMLTSLEKDNRLQVFDTNEIVGVRPSDEACKCSAETADTRLAHCDAMERRVVPPAARAHMPAVCAKVGAAAATLVNTHILPAIATAFGRGGGQRNGLGAQGALHGLTTISQCSMHCLRPGWTNRFVQHRTESEPTLVCSRPNSLCSGPAECSGRG